MKVLFVLCIAASITSCAFAIEAKEDAFSIMPTAREGHSLKPTVENPFRRVMVQKRVTVIDDRSVVERSVRQALGGKGIGGYVLPSAQYRGSVVLANHLFEVGDELCVESGGVTVPIIPNYRITLTDIDAKGVKLEVFAGGDTESGGGASGAVSLPFDDFLRPFVPVKK